MLWEHKVRVRFSALRTSQILFMKTETAELSILEENIDATSNRIKGELIGLGIEKCPNEIIDRLVIIEENSKFNNDSRMICEGFKNVLDAIENSSPIKNHLTPKQRQEGELAAFLHDIGKSGASEADVSGRLAAIRLFSVEKFVYPINTNKTIAEAVRECFPDEYDEMIEDLAKSGVSEEMTVRKFYDKHAEWTHNVLDKYPETFSERTRIVAGSHHIDRDINPYHLSENEIPPESLMIGALEYYVDILEEKILMAVDKYQAAISRRDSSNEKAVEFLRKIFSEKYDGDPIMNLIINTIDELGQKDALFPNTKNKYLSLRKAA
jgi:hypothetical protein